MLRHLAPHFIVTVLLAIAPLPAQGFVRLWQADNLTRLSNPRYRHAAAAHQSKVVAIGGQDENGTLLAAVESYDPIQNQWSNLTSLPLALAGCRAADLGGRLLVMGGESPLGTSLNNSYELVAGVWQNLPPMNSQRADFASCVFNQQVYVFGGQAGVYLSSAERYNSLGNNWLPISPMPAARHQHQAMVVQNRIFIVGGNQRSTWEYLPASNTWTVHASPTADQIFSHVGGTTFGNTVMGGEDSGGSAQSGGRTCEALDLSSGSPRFVACTPPLNFPSPIK